MTRRVKAICMTVLLSLFITQTASANSAPSSWHGTTATGAIIKEKDCPIIVENELLTFNLQEFPQEYYENVDDYLAYAGNVTAEYTFYNPADYKVEATLVFPFGIIPSYSSYYDMEWEERDLHLDTEKYDITIDGKAIEKTVRHTFSFYTDEFELAKDAALLHDGYVENSFYSPDMPVTRYVYKPVGVDVEKYDAATAAIIYSGDATKTKVLMENLSGGSTVDDGIRIDGWVDSERQFALTVIGEPFKEMPEWKFYADGGCTEEIDGEMVLESTETFTFKDIVFAEYDENSKILEHDWYNAFVESLNVSEWEYGVLSALIDEGSDISDSLMRWYEYEISIEPGETIVNTVTAPMYPDIDAGYGPPIYDYTYLLSPAQEWGEFGELEIVVNTPYYMTENSLGTFEKTEFGYKLKQDDLPEGELEFTLSEEENPKRTYNSYQWMLIIATLIPIVGAAIMIISYLKKEKDEKNEKV